MFEFILWLTLLIVAQVLSGIGAYLIFRKIERTSKFPKWTRGDRRVTIVLSCGGMITLIFAIFLYLIEGPGTDKEVKW